MLHRGTIKWSVCWSFLLTTYLLNLEVDFFNKFSTFLWDRTVFPLLADLLLFSPSDTRQNQKDHRSQVFNFTFRYIDDALSINRHGFLRLILKLEFDTHGYLNIKIYDKRDDFNFEIINFPNLSSNIPTSPTYGINISLLIWYSKACSCYSNFVERHQCRSIKLLNQQYDKERLVHFIRKSSLESTKTLLI